MQHDAPREPDSHEQISDGDLLRQLAAGDVGAMESLRGRHETALYAQVFAVLNDAVDAEHVVSETFLQLSRMAASIELGGESVHARIRYIAGRRARDLRRARGQRRLRTV
jgi:DNA-directed RNA polymerase specialized sigma24 family protein